MSGFSPSSSHASGGSGLPSGVTSPGAGALLYVPTSTAVTAVEIDSPVGSSALGSTELVVRDETGNNVGEFDADGSFTCALSEAFSSFVVKDNTGAGKVIEVAAGTKLGFYGHAAVVRPTGVAVTAAGIHAALVSLGLITA